MAWRFSRPTAPWIPAARRQTRILFKACWIALPATQRSYSFWSAAIRRLCCTLVKLKGVEGGYLERSRQYRYFKPSRHSFTPEQWAELRAWEARLCVTVGPFLLQQFANFISMLEDRAEHLQASHKKTSLSALFDVRAAKTDKVLRFGQNFMKRCFPKLSQAQKDESFLSGRLRCASLPMPIAWRFSRR